MDTVLVVDQPSISPLIEAMAIRLADEGVPVRAIARSTQVPSPDIYDMLRDALGRGAILEIPKDDWPPGATRANRSALANTPLQNDEQLKLACARVFKTTRLEAAILAVLLKRNTLTKSQLHQVIEQNRPSPGLTPTDEKMVDVLICHIRKKLRLHDLKIETIWGIGYMIPTADRERSVALLTAAGE